MDLDKIRELIKMFEAAEISEIEIEDDSVRVLLKKAKPAPVVAPQTHIAAPVTHTSAPAEPQTHSSMLPPKTTEEEGSEESAEDEGLLTIDAPMVGVFYAAPGPGEPPYVKAGDVVEAGDTVCIVEAMKLMNEVTAKSPVTIEKVLVENAEPVEFGQPLFAVRPLD